MSLSERKRLGSLKALDLLDTPPEERFDRLTRLTQRTFGVPIATVSLVDADRVWFKSRVGLPASEIPRAGSFCSEATLHETPLVVPDATKDPRFSQASIVAGPPGLRFYAGHPLKALDGEVVGILAIADVNVRDLDGEQRRALRDLADLVQEQLRWPAATAEETEKAALLAALRAAPENVAARRRSRVLLGVLIVILFAVTGLSLTIAGRLAANAERVATEPAAAPGAESASLAAMRSEIRFFRIALGTRALLALLILAALVAAYDRRFDAELVAKSGELLDAQRLRAALDALESGIIVADARGRVTHSNAAAARMLGGDPRTLVHEFGAPIAQGAAGETVRGAVIAAPGGPLTADVLPLARGAVMVFRPSSK